MLIGTSVYATPTELNAEDAGLALHAEPFLMLHELAKIVCLFARASSAGKECKAIHPIKSDKTQTPKAHARVFPLRISHLF